MKAIPQTIMLIASTMVFLTAAASTGESNTTAADTDTAGVTYQLQSQFGDLDEIATRGILRVLVTHSKTDFFIDHGQIRGVQAEYVQEFLKKLNQSRTNRFHASESNRIIPQFVPVAFDELIPSLLAGKGDIAAAFLTMTPERDADVDFISPQGRFVDEILVAHKDAEPIKSLADLAGRTVYVLKGSSYASHLLELNEQLEIVELPPVNMINTDTQLLTEDILELVNAGIVDYTVCDDFKANLWAKALPDIRVYRDIRVSSDQSVGWVIRPNSPQLKAALDTFSKNVKKGSFLGNLLFNKYYASTQWIDNPLAQIERDKFRQIIHLFLRFGEQYQFDPLALAAQGYQESRFDQSLTSHRGAVGVMQLMPSTAKDPNVGIPNIQDIENNIHAGAKYMDFLRNRYFSDDAISPINQRLFAWAAYNAGPANIRRVRAAAEENGLDPNVWFNNVEHMAASKISREPVRYVANIYKYYTAYRLIEDQADSKSAAMKKFQLSEE
ncbi:MAG: lytic transglycosylase F [Gammaproteobacteria bacterium]|nr:lytic transglycosylase F [Gammaproteobacteria bacterium]